MAGILGGFAIRENLEMDRPYAQVLSLDAISSLSHQQVKPKQMAKSVVGHV